MNTLLDLLLGIVEELAFDRIWRIIVGGLLGLGAAYLLVVVVLGLDYHPVWPYVAGIFFGLVFGVCWQARSGA